MGLDINGTQCILYAKSLGVNFARSAMIGRQGLYLSPSELGAILGKFGLPSDEATVQGIFSKNGGYAEQFLRTLGANDVQSFDKSSYEGSTHLHDMNLEVPERFKQQYSVVLDGGSLEHIFNFPVAIKNCMEMVQVGGHYISITPANNFMGHGLYQFSPELFFSVFTAANGYQLVSVVAFEGTADTTWFAVKDPAAINGRVTLTNSKPVYLFIVAKRIENLVPFATVPQQSDYVSTWNEGVAPKVAPAATATPRNPLIATALRYTPPAVKRLARSLLRQDRDQADQPGFNPKFFQPIRLTDGALAAGKATQAR